MLRSAGFQVELIESSCCGMAGSFGYEAEHYEMSMAIGRLLFEKFQGPRASSLRPVFRAKRRSRKGWAPPVVHPAVLLAERLGYE